MIVDRLAYPGTSVTKDGITANEESIRISKAQILFAVPKYLRHLTEVQKVARLVFQCAASCCVFKTQSLCAVAWTLSITIVCLVPRVPEGATEQVTWMLGFLPQVRVLKTFYCRV